ncbi:endonuclease/exonuclease/phosphatase family protein [Gluconacetobacter entanii]|uniref:Endonuclease n=1 Tax=Gluconacetobacter entanii TaxID=108528 RepID=A0A318PUL8_9PROT|nr:endonuclease/exonuclease/phosphatase family protein [Gluconacetobacter entanii]MBE7619018.1 endonuclease/exonuclease/phosphatase family protein [Komagataeibacter sp. FXV2]MCE2577594.1 endonuclease/exonuclease/phosphatase family protein [Komagataeibacter sp. FNDCR1]MBY4641006.1 endonuclease/exonuclease/phosphatase family protein [Gluconacetobacter entanii]MCW4581012.1 endonuclease/exonuclease/phosphatase family protein [Gluconacetobacter entanii]MCW4584319.1 endonuclease/exonuclease/phosphat
MNLARPYLRLPAIVAQPGTSPLPGYQPAFRSENSIRIISWNLLRKIGATVRDVVHLIHQEKPDLLLMQEATIDIDALPTLIGGHYARSPLPGRIHGVACWSPWPYRRPPMTCTLPSGTLIRRVAQIIECGPFAIANVHLSHGQLLNRRQLRRMSQLLPYRAAILGDFNLVGPTLVRHFRDVGPRAPTHRMADVLPIRLDRCLIRGLSCVEQRVIDNYASDHRPIAVRLELLPQR